MRRSSNPPPDSGVPGYTSCFIPLIAGMLLTARPVTFPLRDSELSKLKPKHFGSSPCADGPRAPFSVDPTTVLLYAPASLMGRAWVRSPKSNGRLSLQAYRSWFLPEGDRESLRGVGGGPRVSRVVRLMEARAKEGATARREPGLRAPASELLAVGGRTATLRPLGADAGESGRPCVEVK